MNLSTFRTCSSRFPPLHVRFWTARDTCLLLEAHIGNARQEHLSLRNPQFNGTYDSVND